MGRKTARFLAFLKAWANFDPWLNSSVLEPTREECFCWPAVAMETSRDKRGKRLPESTTSELKTGYSCPSHSYNPIAGFCSSQAVGVVALMERGRLLFTYPVE